MKMFLVLILASFYWIEGEASCLSSGDCGSSEPYCVQGSCVAYCELDIDCQSAWAGSTCTSGLCTCNNDSQCPGRLVCSRTAPKQNRCVACETHADRGCTSRVNPICDTSQMAVADLLSPTTYACRAATSTSECVHSVLMVSRDRTTFNTVNGRCIPLSYGISCTSADSCTSPSAPVCDGTSLFCNIPTNNNDCTNQPIKKVYVDNSCVLCGSNSDCSAGVCDTTTDSCVECMSDTDCTDEAKPICFGDSCGPCQFDTDCAGFATKKRCSSSSRACVECLSNLDCIVPTAPICSPAGQCVACSSDPECADFPTTKACDSGTGACVQCTSNSHCTVLTTPICTANQCVGCISDTDCADFPITKKCDTDSGSGACVQCLSNSDCTVSTSPICASNQCVGCSLNTDCNGFPANMNNCNTATGACVVCVNNAHCTVSTAPMCSPTNQCVACTGDPDCSDFPTTKKCHSGTGACVECTSNTHCTTSTIPICSAANQCVACSSDSDCSGFPNNKNKCNTDTGACVECLDNSHCTVPTSPVCSTNKECTACSLDSDCNGFPNNMNRCKTSNGACVECTSDSHCTVSTSPICRANQCDACLSDSDCSGFATTKKCDTDSGSGACVECLNNSDCTALAAVCSNTNQCTACLLDSDCSGFATTKKCETATGVCVECKENSHCTDSTAPICSTANQCTGCITDTDCSGFPNDMNKCSTGTGACVQCLSNSDCQVYTASVCSATNQCGGCTSDSDCTGFINKSKCNLASGACSPPCTEFCSVCASMSTCTACDPAYYLKNGVCVQDCGSGFFGHTFSLESSPAATYLACRPCNLTCKECQSTADKCTACNLPYLLDDFECKSTQPDLTVTLQATSNPQVFQLVFSRPISISGELRDNLIIKFSNLSSVDFSLKSVTQKANATIFELTFEFQKSINIQTLNITFIDPKSVTDDKGYFVNKAYVQTQTIRFTYFTPQEKALMDTATTAGTAAVSAVMGSSALIAVIAGNPALMLALTSIFQITNYLLYLNVNYPENVNTFFELFSISSLSFIPDPIEVLVPKLYEEMQVPLTSPPKFLDNDTDARFLNNCGLMLTGWGIVGFLYLIIRLLLFSFRLKGFISRLFLYLKSKFEWGLIFGTLIGSFPNLFLAAILQINNLNFQGSLNVASSILELASAIVCISAPFISIYIIDSTAPEWGSKHHHEKYQILYNSFKLLEDKGENASPETAYYRRNFLAIMFIRKMLYLSALVFAYDIPLLQVTCTAFSGLLIIICMVKFKPYEQGKDAWLNVGSEIILLLTHLVIFVLGVDDLTQMLSDNQRKYVGWAIVGLCSLLVIYNFYFVLVEQLSQFRNFTGLIIKLWRLKKGEASGSLEVAPDFKRRLAKSKISEGRTGSSLVKLKKSDSIVTNNGSMITLNQSKVSWETRAPQQTVRRKLTKTKFVRKIDV